MKKIAVICNYALMPERIGGMDYFFWMYDAACKKNGVAVDWFFPNVSDHGDYAKMNIKPFGTRSPESFFLDFRKFENPEYDFIITHFIELCTPFFSKLAEISNAKIIAIDHNPRPIGGYSLKKKIDKRIKGILFSRYINQFVGVSEYTSNAILNDFGAHLKKKTITIYNGIQTTEIRQRIIRNSQNPSFLVASHLRESKGIQDLIAAVAQLPKSTLTKLKIDIYGEGPYENFLREKIKNQELESVFEFMGSRPNLHEIFCQYDYMLQPTHMECFSLSILESLAANVPVITTNVGGNEEALTNGENGFIFKAKNVNALAEILENILNGNLKIEKEVSSFIASNFSLEQMVDKHLKLLEK